LGRNGEAYPKEDFRISFDRRFMEKPLTGNYQSDENGRFY